MPIPESHQVLMPYLMLQNTPGFIQFCQEVFGAELSQQKMREDQNTIMHAELRFQGQTLMCAEATQDWKAQNAHLFIYV
ncbi:MAG: VOC family protein, partial [Bacteroidota bacterium]